MIDIEAIFQRNLMFAEQRLLTHGEIRPMFSVHFERDGEHGIAALKGDFSDLATKRKSVNLVRIVGVALNASAISLITEAWVATVNKQTDPAIAALAPSDRMDRQEVVVVLMSMRDRPTMLSAREIVRDADGKATALLPAAPSYDGLDGLMVNLLADGVPTEKDQRRAQKLLEMLGISLEELRRPH